MIEPLRIAQLLIAFLALVLLTKSFFLATIRRSRPGDGVRAAVWFNTAVIFGFCIRWVVFPHFEVQRSLAERELWAALYALGCVSIPLLVMVTWRVRD